MVFRLPHNVGKSLELRGAPRFMAPSLITPRIVPGKRFGRIGDLEFPGLVDPSFLGDITTAGLLTNLELLIDVGSADSYDGSGQKLTDLAGSGYDFFLGADVTVTTDDPTFNGVSGALSSSEYFSFDGADSFRYDAANEAWMDNMHKDNALFSFVGLYYIKSGGDQTLWGSDSSDNSDLGCSLQLGQHAAGKIRLFGGNGASTLVDARADTSPTTDAWNFIGVSVDEAAGAGGSFHYLNGAYNQVSSSDTFDATYSSPSASGATHTLELCSSGDQVRELANLSRFGGCAFWSTDITKANMDTLYASMGPRYGLS